MTLTKHILLVEDNPGDAFLAKKAFEREQHLDFQIHVVSDGPEALRFLYRRGEYTEAPRPHIILLDLNLPGIPGIEVLRDVKADMSLGRIPVVILSSSNDESDVTRAFDSHAAGYFIKPNDMISLSQVVSVLERYWFTVGATPPNT